MSRVVTPPSAKPAQPATSPVPFDKIAQRAYEKWCQRGRPQQGTDKQDWYEAEAELRAEFNRTTPATAVRR
jgi:hypothetical protein